MPIRFRPPRDIPDLGLTRGQQERFNAWLRTAFTEIAEDMAALGQSDAPTIVAQETIDVAAGSMRRVTPPVGGMAVRVPAPTPANAGQTVRLMIEAPVGDLTVVSVPGIGDDGKVFQPTINGEPRATFTTSGLVTLTSNGSSDWKSASEFAAESPASVALRSGGAALDAQYLLRSANAQLPNARVADDSTEIDISYSSPGLISWFLKTASVGFSKLANLTGLSVLGRAANSSGVMAAITATSAKQVLRNSGDTLHWEYPVTVGSPFDWIFDGVDDVITAGDVLDMDRTTPRSIFIWYATTDTADPIALGKHSSAGAAGWRLAVSSSGLDWILRGTAQQLQAGLATPAPLDGSMHMLGLTYDGSSNANGVEFYLDTVNVAKTVGVNNLTSDSTQNATNFTVGARSSPTQLFPGGLKHVSVWNRVLTAGEVAQLSNAGEPADLSVLSFFSDCILWYKLDETDATGANGVVDHSASGFDGTAQGGLGPSGAGGQVHSFVEGGGVALDVAANIATVTREALTGFAQAAAGSNATTSAEPLVTYSASGNMSAERVLTTSTTNAVSTAVAGQIQVQRTALTGFAAASANSNATTSAEPLVAYSASANMSAERVLTTSTSETVDISVAGQIQIRSAAKTGAISQAANANATLFAGIRDNGAAENDRTNLNFVNTTFITAAVTDDAGNDELEIGYTWTGVAVERNNVAVGSGVTAWDYGVTAPLTLSVSIVSNEVSVTYALDLTANITWTGIHRHDNYITFGDPGAIASGDIRKNSDFLMSVVGAIELRTAVNGGNLLLGTGASGEAQLGGEHVRLRADQNVYVVSGTSGTGAGHLVMIGGASGNTPATDEGEYWVDDTTAAQTLPGFTDDDDDDHNLAYAFTKTQSISGTTGAAGTIALDDNATVVRWSASTGAINVDGFSGKLWNGRRVLLRNANATAANTVTLNPSAAATSSHSMVLAGTGGDTDASRTKIIRSRGQIMITYDTSSSRWFAEAI